VYTVSTPSEQERTIAPVTLSAFPFSPWLNLNIAGAFLCAGQSTAHLDRRKPRRPPTVALPHPCLPRSMAALLPVRARLENRILTVEMKEA